MASPRSAYLHIESSLHGCRTCKLQAGATVVGSDLNCDIVLADDGVAPAHLRLVLGDTLTLAALDAPALLDGASLPPGEARPLRCSARLQAGDAVLRVELRHPPTPRLPLWRRDLAIGIPLACAIVLLVVVTGRAAAPGALKPPAAAFVANAVAPVPHLGPPAQPDLRAELDRRHLESIEMSRLPDGSLEASGTVAPAQLASWREAARWLDGESSGTVVLVDRVRVTADVPRLAVQAAWVGPKPYVIDGAGRKLFVGAATPDGWVIAAIVPGQVTVKRAGQTIVVRF